MRLMSDLKNENVWHLCTPGSFSGLLFRCREDFVFGMNMVALSVHQSDGIGIYTFELMNNHVHFVLEGEEDCVRDFFERFRFNCFRMWCDNAGVSNVRVIEPNLLRIDSLRYLQNLIVYVNRNGYVVDESVTPFSYPWGANSFFFNGLKNFVFARKFANLGGREKRAMFKKREIVLPDDWDIIYDYVSPMSYCKIDTAESLFMNAHHYFSSITKNIESFKEIAIELGDDVFYTDNDLFRIAAQIGSSCYKTAEIAQLSKKAKIEMAIRLRKEYNASRKQLCRVLKLDTGTVDSLFPNLRKY